MYEVSENGLIVVDNGNSQENFDTYASGEFFNPEGDITDRLYGVEVEEDDAIHYSVIFDEKNNHRYYYFVVNTDNSCVDGDITVYNIVTTYDGLPLTFEETVYVGDEVVDNYYDYEFIYECETAVIGEEEIGIHYGETYAIDVKTTPGADISDYSFDYYSTGGDADCHMDEDGNIHVKGKAIGTVEINLYDKHDNLIDTCVVDVTYSAWNWICYYAFFGWIWM